MGNHPLHSVVGRWKFVVAGLGALLALAGAVTLPGAFAGSAGQTPPVQVLHNSATRAALKSDTSPPLASLRPLRNPSLLPPEGGPENPNPLKHPGRSGIVDQALQKVFGPLAMPSPIANFDGEYNEYGPIPPDTNGDVGRNHYIGSVNSGFTVYNKTGTVLYGPANNNTLFIGFGGLCEATNSGDPVALYDSMADRWVLNWFAFASQAGPTHQCVAVSASPDPLGPWYRYDFQTGNGFEDYPHMTVWPDAYYMSSNTFNDGANTAGLYAFDRAKMLRGDPTATVVIFHLQGDGGMLSSNFEGAIPPPAGSPNYFWEWYNTSPGQIAEFKFHADFSGGSTLTGPFVIGVNDFVWPLCAASRERCVPQPGTTAQLETIGDRLMYRVEYRNFGTYESVVLNHTVNAAGLAAPRWYEMRAPNGPSGATVFQQGTYAPADGVHRWMGSIAQDRNGDIAMGFSVSSSTLFPSIRYAGRLPTDPAGTFGQGEATLIAGTGSEDFPAAPRWGDYSSLSVDPVDDCTFWYTTEYFSQTGLRDWRTRIGSFKFSQCAAQGSPTPVPSATAVAASRTPVVTTTPCAGSTSVVGAITTADPTQTGRLGLGDPKSSCLVPKTAAGLSDNLTRHYDSYTYTNSSGSPQCVTASFTQDCGNNAIQSVAYLGTFDPNNIATNYLADGGASGHDFSYSFSLGAGQTAVIVVVEVSPNLGCTTYHLTINPCAPPATPTTGPTNTTTRTSTPLAATNTPSATPTTVCTGTTYQTFPSTGATMIPGGTDIGNHCDDCLTSVTFPFPVTLYGTSYTSANAGSNGMLEFVGTDPNIYTQNCIPVRTGPSTFFLSTLFAYYDDLRTDITPTVHGIFTQTLGTPGSQQFVIRWQTTYFADDASDANFEVVLTQNSPAIQVIYGPTSQAPAVANPAAGIELNGGQYTSYACDTPIPAGTSVLYVPITCGVTPSATPGPPTHTPVPPTATNTALPQPTNTTPPQPTNTTPPQPTTTSPPQPTETVCPVNFSDVHPTDYFYRPVQYLYCRGVISGYGDNTFRPYNNTTRGQMVKIVILGFSKPIVTPTGTAYTFADVPRAAPFWSVIETAAADNIVSGYNCGGPGEPCDSQNRPYFRPNADVTRGQLSKIDAVAAGWVLQTPATPTFADVPASNPFFPFVETAACHGVVSGYTCGGPNEPCDAQHRPYFRPFNDATRGQIAKIVYISLTTPGACGTR